MSDPSRRGQWRIYSPSEVAICAFGQNEELNAGEEHQNAGDEQHPLHGTCQWPGMLQPMR
jgi:hypothetical protein